MFHLSNLWIVNIQYVVFFTLTCFPWHHLQSGIRGVAIDLRSTSFVQSGMDCGKVALPPQRVAGDFHWKVKLVQTSTFLREMWNYVRLPLQRERDRYENSSATLGDYPCPTVSCSPAFLGSVIQGDVRLGRGHWDWQKFGVINTFVANLHSCLEKMCVRTLTRFRSVRQLTVFTMMIHLRLVAAATQLQLNCMAALVFQ